eukprot:6210666-Pleurochrysis_carterae.AAC.2
MELKFSSDGQREFVATMAGTGIFQRQPVRAATRSACDVRPQRKLARHKDLLVVSRSSEPSGLHRFFCGLDPALLPTCVTAWL